MTDRRQQPVVRYPWQEAPPGGTAIEVAPGILWVQMPLPFALNHVNLYILDDGDGWTVIDCGFSDDTTRTLWQQVMRDHLAAKPVKRLLVTHFHPDHMGLCRWMADTTGAELWMSLAEWTMSHFAYSDNEDQSEATLAFWHRNGMSDETLNGMRKRGNFYNQSVGRPPFSFNRLREGDMVEAAGRRWRVIIGEGHAPEHVCLACEDEPLLLAGDQVLPRITTNVAVYATEPNADPLGRFLACTHKFEHLAQDTLVLCAHDRPFLNMHARLEQLRAHHDQRLDDAEIACGEAPRHAVDLFPVLFHRPLDLHQQSFAIGESIAHLHRLHAQGRVTPEEDADGVVRYRRV